VGLLTVELRLLGIHVLRWDPWLALLLLRVLLSGADNA
jgi:hypothetical protein